MGQHTVPQSITFEREVKVTECNSVCSYQGVTYIAGNEFIGQFRESDYMLQCPGKLIGNFESIVVHHNKLYTLSHTISAYTISTYDLSNTQLISWTHNDSSFRGHSQLTIADDKIIIPNKQTQQLTVYSLVGEVIKHIDCPLLEQDSVVGICAVNSRSVVVSCCEASKVFRVNIDTEEVNWTSTDVSNPGGVTCYSEDFILVADIVSTQPTISILDAKTGIYYSIRLLVFAYYH